MRRTAGIILVEVAFAAALTVVPMIVPSIEPSTGYVLLSVCLLLAALGGMLYFWPQTSEPEKVSGMGDSYNNSGTNFGHMGPINNYGPQKLLYSDELARELLEALPEKKPVTLKAVGSREDQSVGAHFGSVLKASGYEVALWGIGSMSPPPNKKITVSDLGSSYLVVIAPSA